MTLSIDDRALHRQIRGLFLGGFDGAELSPAAAAMLGQGLRGLVLFARNVVDLEQVSSLNGAIREAAGDGAERVVIGVDQEGGRVARLRGGLWVPPAMAAVAERADPAAAEAMGRAMGRRLASLGFNLNFAPVLDLNTNPANPVIGDRSFGSDPERVSAFGLALARGLESAGVAACGKHFPGHGDTDQDSHLALPRLRHDRRRLDAVELVPFAAAAGADIASMMTAHIVFEAIDDTVPATMSRAVIQGLLRDELGYDGVVMSDDLEMKAIADHYAIGESAVACFAAGVDLLLVCHRLELVEQAVAAVAEAVEAGRLSRARIDEATRRVEALAGRFAWEAGTAGQSASDCAAAERELADRLGSAAGAGVGHSDPTAWLSQSHAAG
jgi:beta-N-acetylhexosaminidase